MDRKNEIVNSAFSHTMELTIADEIDVSSYKRVPFDELLSFGMAASSFSGVLSGIAKTSSGALYSLDMHGIVGHLAARSDGSGLTTAIVQNGKGIVGNASLVPADEARAAASFNPIGILVAIAVYSINQKLDKIIETQNDILEFLKEKDKAQIKGNIIALTDIFNNYKYNSESELFKSSNHNQIVQIKREAEQEIIFHREEITKEINKQNLVYFGDAVKKRAEKLKEEFKFYQLSLYMFSFASYLDILLLCNFESDYLDNILGKINDYDNNYREIYSKCSYALESFAGNSVEKNVLKGVSAASKFLGDAASNVPLLKNTKLKRNLSNASENIDELNDNRTKGVMLGFKSDIILGENTFSANIKRINNICNGENAILVDKSAIYIR